MINFIGEKLLKIAKKLDDDGQYKAADSITNVMVRLSQFDMTTPEGQAEMVKAYTTPGFLNNSTTFSNLLPFKDPSSWQPLINQNAPIPMSAYDSLKGTEYYKYLPYFMSPQYQQDVITHNDNPNYFQNFQNGTNNNIVPLNSLTPQEKDLINTYANSCVYSGQPVDKWIAQYGKILNPKLLPLFKQVCENFPRNNYSQRRPLTPLEAYEQRGTSYPTMQQKPRMQYFTYNMADPSKSGPAAGTVFNSTSDKDFYDRLTSHGAKDNPYWAAKSTNGGVFNSVDDNDFYNKLKQNGATG